jgi:hypothetical protein
MNKPEIDKFMNSVFGASDALAHEVITNDIDEDDVEQLELEPLDDSQIRMICGPDTKIIMNAELANYKSINDILTNVVDCFFLLYGPPMNGHWCLVSKVGDKLEYFNSYGKDVGPIDTCCKWYNDIDPEHLQGGATPYLTDMLQDYDGDIEYNLFPFQNAKRRDVATCGRWCCFRWIAQRDGVDLENFIEIVKQTHRKTGLTLDEIVSDLLPNETND